MADDPIRDEAIRSIKRKREFSGHLVAYVLVNLMLVAIWAFTGAGFFWPIFPMLGWGVGLGFHAWDAYGTRRRITEDDIRLEMRRLGRGE